MNPILNLFLIQIQIQIQNLNPIQIQNLNPIQIPLFPFLFYP
jgi:hypothetical protein